MIRDNIPTTTISRVILPISSSISRTAPRNMASSPLNIRMGEAAVNMNMVGLKLSQKDKLSKTGTKAMILGRGREE